MTFFFISFSCSFEWAKNFSILRTFLFGCHSNQWRQFPWQRVVPPGLTSQILIFYIQGTIFNHKIPLHKQLHTGCFFATMWPLQKIWGVIRDLCYIFIKKCVMNKFWRLPWSWLEQKIAQERMRGAAGWGMDSWMPVKSLRQAECGSLNPAIKSS